MALLDGGRIEAVRYKYNLPNYGVFDEKRVFAAGPLPQPIAFRGVKLGVPICEDIWSEDACQALAGAGAELLIVPNGSPYWIGQARRCATASRESAWPRRGCRSPMSIRSADRTSLCSTAPRSC